MGKTWAGPVAVGLAANLLVLAVAGVRIEWLLLVVVLLLALPGSVALLRRPQLGILFLAAASPFDGLLLLVPEVGLLAGWKEAVVLATLVATFLAPEAARSRNDRRARPGWAPGAVALVGVGLVSALMTPGGHTILGLKISFFYLLVPVIIWRCPLDGRERDRLVTVLVAVGTVTAAYGVLQQAIGAEGLHAMGYEYNEEIRFSGPFLRSFSTFIQPFPFALFLMVAMLVAVAAALADPRRLRSRVTFAVLPLLALALGLTFVRAAWLGLGLGLLVLGIKRHRALLMGVPVALLLVAVLPGSVATTALSDESSRDRLATWSENLGSVIERPGGAGIGTAGSAAARALQEGAVSNDSGDLLLLPDNQYFKVLYELGVIGLWLFVLVLWSVYRGAAGVARGSTGRDAALAWGVTATIAAAAAASLMANVFEIFPVDLLLWTLIGIVSSGWGAAAPRTDEVDDRSAASVG